MRVSPVPCSGMLLLVLLAACSGESTPLPAEPEAPQQTAAADAVPDAEPEAPQQTAAADAVPNAAEEEDMVTSPSGLKYKEIVEGTGPSPKAGDTVSVHYTGWLTNGTKFDSSLDRGSPFSFRLGAGQVIKGWDEGVATMKTGGKRKLEIPPELGYGARGAGRLIPPNAVLVFEIELLNVRSAAPPQ